MVDDANSFGGSLMKMGTLFGGMRSANTKAREEAEKIATRTEEQRKQARGRQRSVQLNIRCKPITKAMLEALAIKIGLSKTDIIDLAIREMAQKHKVYRDA